MLGINFEKGSRPKNKERNYIEEETEKYKHPDYQDSFDSKIESTDKLSEDSLRSAGFYDNEDRLNTRQEIRDVMAMSPGPEKDEAFFAMKENFLWQQQGLAVLKDELSSEISLGDNINLERINEIITENDEIYNFSSAQISVIKKMTRHFLTINQAVNNFYNNNFQNPNKIYKQFYNIEPIGKVELRKGPISLAFICDNPDDYARMYRNDNSGRRDLGDEEKKRAYATGGFFSWSYPAGFPELKGTIIGVRGEYYWNIDEVIDHEEQHAINKIYLDNIRLLEKEGLCSILYSCENKKQMRDVLSSYCHYLIHNASNRAKDEILAYKTGGRGEEAVTEVLTKSKKSGGLYDYFDVDKKIKSIEDICEENDILKQYKDEFLNLASKILKDEYKILITNGLKAVNVLRNKNYSQAAITAILMPQNLENWLRAAGRAKFSNYHSKPQNELQNMVSGYGSEDLLNLKQKLPKQ